MSTATKPVTENVSPGCRWRIRRVTHGGKFAHEALIPARSDAELIYRLSELRPGESVEFWERTDRDGETWWQLMKFRPAPEERVCLIGVFGGCGLCDGCDPPDRPW